MRKKLILLIVPVLLALQACAGERFTYSLPPGEKAGACAQQCREQQAHCRSEQLRAYDECAGAPFLDRRSYELCERARGEIPADCLAPRTCAPPDIETCREEFHACWSACGGEVIPQKGK